MIESPIRDPAEDELANYFLVSTIILNSTEFGLSAIGDESYVAMLRGGAIAACTALDAGQDLAGTIDYALSVLPDGLPDPLEGSAGFTLAIQLVTSGVDTFCPRLSFEPDPLELSNAWSSLTGGEIIDPESIIEDGVWVVGENVQPGTYRNSGGGGCYWERLSGFGGTPSDLIANGFSEDPQIVTIAASDTGFSSDGCGIWTLQE